MPDKIQLLPAPRQLTASGGVLSLPEGRLILLDGPSLQDLRFPASRIQGALRARTGLDWEVVASSATPQQLLGLTLRVRPDGAIRPQGYELAVTPEGILIESRDAAGAFYGACTLAQLVDQFGRELPCLRVSDWPDFLARGVMLDVSRDKVPTFETLLALVDMLASWKVNQLQLYTEHTFAYRNHPEVWAEASPITGQEVLELDAYCRERHLELVPNQNSFGHMHRWLQHPRYASLSEVADGFTAPWGRIEGTFSLCPLDPGSIELVSGLYDELLPHFSSRLFNVGCDETHDVGQGRSAAECARVGGGRVYLDFLLKIHREVAARDRTTMFWGDIIVGRPDLIPELPKEAIALEWGYEADHPFAEHGARFADAGIPFYVCPGTSAWRSIAGRTDNALGNLLNAAENGLRHGAVGYLNTDWGDYGHWQVAPVSYLGFAVGAAYSWALDANRAMDVPAVLSRYAFRDPSGSMGRLAYDLGNVYRCVGDEPHNNSALQRFVEWPLERIRSRREAVTPTTLARTLEAVDQAMQPLEQAEMGGADASLIAEEFRSTAHLLRHACRRGLLALEDSPTKAADLKRDLDADLTVFLEGYREVWLRRNRLGGLVDSVAKLEKARAAYRE